MDKDKALDLALEALEYIHEGANNQGPHTGISWRCVAVKAEPAIKAIKQVRALDKKAENARELGLDYEPVLKDNSNYRYDPPVAEPVATLFGSLPVYDTTPHAAQRKWVGLTDEEKQEWIDAMPYDIEPRHCMILVNVIEAKLKEKNT